MGKFTVMVTVRFILTDPRDAISQAHRVQRVVHMSIVDGQCQ